jgi:replicative DNA helicase
MAIETTILSSIVKDEQYARKVIPFLKEEYFQNVAERIVLKKINEYMDSYNKAPTSDTLLIELGNDTSLVESDYTTSITLVKTFSEYSEDHDRDWLVDKTEQFCQEKAVYNAIMESIHIIDGKAVNKAKDAIPSILSDALSVAFDNNIGHDFLEDWMTRYDFYHTVEEKVPFDIDYLNKITKGGVSRKSLNIILAGTGVGKSLAMCHFAANNLMEGKNVLYITMEMAEEKIAERIDANLLNVTMDELETLPKMMYDKKIAKLRERTTGKLIVKEFPTASAHAGHFRHLVNELKIKKGFEPDIIYIDYLNICASSRMKGVGGSVNTYSYIKSIAEELRGLAVEKDVPIFSATQTTRSGYTNSDVGLEDTSESFGLPATADLMFAIISTEELEALNQVMVKQLKNRYNDPTQNKRFVVGIDRARMRLYDAEESAQHDVMDGPAVTADVPVFDKGINKFEQKDFKALFT